MDSFMVAFAVAHARALLASHLPRVSGAMHRWEETTSGMWRAAGLVRRSGMIAILVWVACYASTVPWMAMDADAPILTAWVATVGTAIALIAYCCWGLTVAARSLRAKLIKA